MARPREAEWRYPKLDILAASDPSVSSAILSSPRGFPEDARHDPGYQLEKMQRGQPPDDFKPMPPIGTGVEEIRIADESGAYRVIYVARRLDAVYVLHAFQHYVTAGYRNGEEAIGAIGER